jgi:catechol 2,3-dioxygenase-like lactoylglutathione lyase family enzyme
VSARDPDVAWKATKPSGAEAAPKREPDERNNRAEDGQYFSDFLHVARQHRVRRSQRQPCLAAHLGLSACSKSMKLGQLSEAALYASDLGAAERFYHDVLGLDIVSTMEQRGISFRCGETILLVFDPERTRIPDAGVPTHGANGEGHIAFVVDGADLDPWRARLGAAGVAVESEVAWPSGGRSLYFRDPAGNVVELAPPTLWRSPL